MAFPLERPAFGPFLTRMHDLRDISPLLSVILSSIVRMSEKSPTLLYCRCAYAQVVPTGVKNAVLEQLCASGASFETVADLCEMAAHRDPRLQQLAGCGRLKIAACYPRAVTGLFHQAGAPLPDGTEILNMRSLSAEEITRQMLTEETAALVPA